VNRNATLWSLPRPRPPERASLAEELYSRYGGRVFRHRLTFLRKRYAWFLVVGGTRGFKRLLDILGSLAALALASPVMALVAISIKLTDGGSIFYIAPRVGKYGREFPFPKFRSMVLDAESMKADLMEASLHADHRTFKMKKDPRVTWIGRIIRKTSIDELPQLWCVLRGDMALVGPRPPLPIEVEKYTLSDRARLNVKPGLTCLWQVSGRGELPFEQQMELDLQYIDSQSLWLDLKILLRTIPAVLVGRGAY